MRKLSRINEGVWAQGIRRSSDEDVRDEDRMKFLGPDKICKFAVIDGKDRFKKSGVDEVLASNPGWRLACIGDFVNGTHKYHMNRNSWMKRNEFCMTYTRKIVDGNLVISSEDGDMVFPGAENISFNNPDGFWMDDDYRAYVTPLIFNLWPCGEKGYKIPEKHIELRVLLVKD